MSAELTRSRPNIQKDYGIPESEEGMLSWDFVTDRLAAARNYWVSTTRPDGRPHATPSWAVWLDGTLYFGGGRQTRKARNMAANPAVVVHLESGDEVVILEGVVEEITDPALQERIDDAYEAKYGMRHGTPVWALRVEQAFAWSGYPTTVTRWRAAP